MKRVYTYIICILFAGMHFSCVQDQTKDVAINAVGRDVIYARMGERTQLNDSQQMSWTAGDSVYVVGFSNKEYKFKAYKFDGATGDRSGSFTAIPELNLYENGSMYSEYYTNQEAMKSIEWWWFADGEYIRADFAVSPYRGYEVDWWEHFYCRSSNTAQQNYIPGSSDPNANIVVGVSTDGKTFDFKNLLGFLRLSLTGDKKVKSIVLSENKGSAIGGKFLFNIKKLVDDEIDDNEFIWKSIDYTETEYFQSSSITLNCGEEGVQLSGTPTNFYFAVIPVVMSEGLSIEVHFTDGTIFTQSTSKSIEIKRSTLTPMAAISTSNIEYKSFSVTYRGSTIAAIPEIAGSSNTSGYIDWGDGNISLLKFATSYTYLDENDTHTVTFNVRNANIIKFNGFQGVTTLDVSNF